MKAITNINQLDFTKKYTYADYLTWMFTDRVELIKGWIHKMCPAPNVNHQRVSGKLHAVLFNYLATNTCEVFSAPFDVRLFKKNSKDTKVLTVVQPDLCIICDPKKLDRSEERRVGKEC